ncbi:MAG: ribosome biogenesis factor YjgA [Pedobacter sp.]
MDDFEQERPPSRSALKRAAKAVEEMAARLADLGDGDFKRLPLTGEIREGIEETRRFKSHNSARKRQLKHLAGLLRSDADAVQVAEEFLAEIQTGRHKEAADFHHIEALRERLCDAEQFDAALEEVRQNMPGVNLAKIQRLAESARVHSDRRAFRELFRILKAADSGDN